MKFSPSMQGFYPDSATFPDDLVSISDSDYQLGLKPREEYSTLAIKKGKLVVIPAPAPTAAQLSEILKTNARAALPETDMVFLRCGKAGVAFPSEWATYATDLRNIANGTDTTSISLPTKPPYPSGT